MIIVTNDEENSLLIDNGDKFDNPIKIEMSTVCTGDYTDFMVTLPEGAIVKYPRKETRRKLALPLIVRAPSRSSLRGEEMKNEILVPMDLSDAIGLIERQEQKIAALQELSTNLASENKEAAQQIATLTERLSQTVSCVDYKQQTCTLCTAMTAENERLREMMSVMPESFWAAQAALKKGE